jgi:hypothetical protein
MMMRLPRDAYPLAPVLQAPVLQAPTPKPKQKTISNRVVNQGDGTFAVEEKTVGIAPEKSNVQIFPIKKE